MKNVLLITLIVVSFFAVYQPQSVEANNPTITLVNPPANNAVHLTVGETFTAEAYVESDVEFIWAVAGSSFYYPGNRYVTAENRDRVSRNTTATLALTYTAVGSTADLPDGYAPVYLVVGVRYQGGVVISQQFEFAVYVE